MRAQDDVGATTGPQMDGVASGTRTGIATGGAGAETGATAVATTGIGLYAGIYPAFGGWTGVYLCASTRRAPWFIPQTLEPSQGTPKNLGRQKLEEFGTDVIASVCL